MGKVYKLKPIELPTRSYSDDGNHTLRNNYVPDQLIVFIYVHDIDDTTKWEDVNDIEEIENDITKIDPLRLGFNEERYTLMLEYISFQVFNNSGVWDEILSRDTISEVRILRARTNSAGIYENFIGEFYGIIEKTLTTHTNDVGPTDPMWGRYRKYTFYAINYLKRLKEIPIMDLRNYLDRKINDSLVNPSLDNPYQAIEGNNIGDF